MNIYDLRDRVMMLPTLEKKMTLLREEIREAEEEVSNLLRQHERERRDVERMQRDSLSSFMLKLFKKYENKLEKEYSEEIKAKLAYDRAVTHLDHLIREKEQLALRISELQEEEKTYRAELKNRRGAFSGELTGPKRDRFDELEVKRNIMISQRTEIKEALRSASRVKTTAEAISESLNHAERWAAIDTYFRGGIWSHSAKYSYIDEAEVNFANLSSGLRQLNKELGDVRGLSVPVFHEISSGQRTIDYWFDNIFTDISVWNHIKGNAEQVGFLHGNIVSLESILKEKLSVCEKELEGNQRDEEELLLSLNPNELALAEENRKRQLGKIEQRNLGGLLDKKIIEEARICRRIYGKLVCISFLRGKLQELGLGEMEITEEDLRFLDD